MVSLLPSPADAANISLTSRDGDKESHKLLVPSEQEPLCALAFKVVHDANRGHLVFCRVFSGRVKSKEAVYNASTGKAERIQQLLGISADEFSPLQEAGPGSVCCITGFRHTRAGDTIFGERGPLQAYRLEGMRIPQPVYCQAIEPERSADISKLDAALKILSIEDPSLEVSVDEESGQILLRGLGELHIEIICDKLKRQHNLNIFKGKTYIAYRETLVFSSPEIVIRHSAVYDKEIDGKRLSAEFEMVVSPRPVGDIATFTVDLSVKEILTSEEYHALIDSINTCFRHGVKGYPVVGLHVAVVGCKRDARFTTPGAVRACISTAITQLLLKEKHSLVEPLMALEVELPDAFVGEVVSDLSGKRRAHHVEIKHSEVSNQSSLIKAHVPLRSILGYAKSLRSMTQGYGSFTSEYHSLSLISDQE